MLYFLRKEGMQTNMKLCENNTKSFLIKHIFYFILFSNFLFCIGVELIENTAIVSGVEQSDSVMHIRASIPFPFGLLQSSEQSSLCRTAGLCWLPVLHRAVCTCSSQTPYLSLPPTPPISPPATIRSFFESVSLINHTFRKAEP